MGLHLQLLIYMLSLCSYFRSNRHALLQVSDIQLEVRGVFPQLP